MNTLKSLFLLITLLSLPLFSAAQNAKYNPAEEIVNSQKDFQDMKFGVFIHWGLYSMLGQGEWVMTNQDINYKEYSKLAGGFYPVRFNAEQWVSAIKASGAGYICITSRHHDGFSMFGTKQTPYNIVDATPFGRDILKEISLECEKQGIRLHFYYSLIDWYRDDYQPIGRTGRGTGRPGEGKWEDYFNFMTGQLTELLTNYGKIGCIWLDGHWDQDENHAGFDWEYDKMYPLIHRLQPGCLIGNNHHITPFEGEDIQIFERDVPGENSAGWHSGGISSLPLETCQTMNDSWGYRIKDRNYKSINYLIQYLVGTAGRNANLLLNVGPQPDGELPEAAIERLKAMGQWLSKYGETIYGTRSTLLPPQPWGVITEKGDKIWLHIFPENIKGTSTPHQIYVPFTDNTLKIKSATQFDTKLNLPFKQYREGLFITVGDIPQGTPDYIIELEKK
ncbi:MAG: alpha-L-fucosidase [Bacteroidales bacterium]|nr:alpha-L-fucosidase [Bacteroidales bacterium]MDD4670942.1 alpha-L-fucosidase [Bacteroidales bacterium]